ARATSGERASRFWQWAGWREDWMRTENRRGWQTNLTNGVLSEAYRILVGCPPGRSGQLLEHERRVQDPADRCGRGRWSGADGRAAGQHGEHDQGFPRDPRGTAIPRQSLG